MNIIKYKPVVAVRLQKTKSLTSSLTAIGVHVKPGEVPTAEHVNRAHGIYIQETKAASGKNVMLNNLWNEIKRHVCHVCGGVKLRAKSVACSNLCAMNAREVKPRTLAAFAICLLLALTGCTGRQNPGRYKPGKGESWTGNPAKTNAAATPPKPFDPSQVSERMTSARAHSFVVAPPATNGFYELEWTQGADRATGLSNVATGAVLLVGDRDNATWTGFRPGETNTFVAFNSYGVSNPLTAVATTNRAGVAPSASAYTSRVTWAGGGTLQRSADLKVWQATIATSPATVTNTGTAGFFRVEGTPTALSIAAYQTLLRWQVAASQTNRLQRLVQPSTGSWADVAGFLSASNGIAQVLTTNAGKYRVLQ